MKKKLKAELRRDSVNSSSFHVGIELELKIPCGGNDEHDDDACSDNYREYLGQDSDVSVLRNEFGVDRNTAISLAPFFNRDEWIDSRMNDYYCDDPDCGFRSASGHEARNELERALKKLTGNQSVKVVEDGSIDANDDDETDAEVCWNYFASKETLGDNEKILAHLLNDTKASFDSSCGLHINLNNYLDVRGIKIETSKLDFLFNFVAPSRRTNSFCSRFGMSGEDKYSMIYNQGDRLEFRFFSPTLSSEKLHQYVILANTVYKRLAGKDSKLPRKTMKYFIEKMTKVNGLSFDVASESIKKVNSMPSAIRFQTIEDAGHDAPGVA